LSFPLVPSPAKPWRDAAPMVHDRRRPRQSVRGEVFVAAISVARVGGVGPRRAGSTGIPFASRAVRCRSGFHTRRCVGGAGPRGAGSNGMVFASRAAWCRSGFHTRRCGGWQVWKSPQMCRRPAVFVATDATQRPTQSLKRSLRARGKASSRGPNQALGNRARRQVWKPALHWSWRCGCRSGDFSRCVGGVGPRGAGSNGMVFTSCTAGVGRVSIPDAGLGGKYGTELQT
jgi:hypothetical protein